MQVSTLPRPELIQMADVLAHEKGIDKLAVLHAMEEGISKAAWVAKSSLPPYLLNTYPSIVEVFREAKV